jgi:hypothetical protein
MGTASHNTARRRGLHKTIVRAQLDIEISTNDPNHVWEQNKNVIHAALNVQERIIKVVLGSTNVGEIHRKITSVDAAQKKNSSSMIVMANSMHNVIDKSGMNYNSRALAIFRGDHTVSEFVRVTRQSPGFLN